MIYNIHKKLHKKVSAFILLSILFILISPIFAKKAEAQWVVFDPTNFAPNTVTSVSEVGSAIREYGLDAVAWVLVNLVIERMSASTVNWINGGFKGSPAYVTDPESYFGDLGNRIAGQFIFTSPNLNFLCGSMSSKVRIALSRSYTTGRDPTRNWQCKLTDVQGNLENFMSDFERGGWDKFFVLSQDSTQNPLGIYIEAEGQLAREIARKANMKQNELSWGNGFLSWKTCSQYSKAVAGQDLNNSNMTSTTYDSEGNPVDSNVPNQTLPDTPRGCVQEQINTPGSVISTKLNDVLNVGNDKLAVADEINEMVSALLNQLVNRVVGGIGKGLRGLSRPDSSSGNQTFASQLTQRKPGDPIVGYFCLDQPGDPGYDPTGQTCSKPDKPDTSILDIPPYVPSQGPSAIVCQQNPTLPECQSTATTTPPPSANVPSQCRSNPTLPECNNINLGL